MPTTWGSPLTGALTLISRDRTLKVGDQVKTVIESNSRLINVPEATYLNALVDQLEDNVEINLKYVRVEYFNKTTSYIAERGGQKRTMNYAQIRIETQYEVTHASPIAPFIVVGLILAVCALIGLIVVVREIHWFIAKVIDVAETVAQDITEPIGKGITAVVSGLGLGEGLAEGLGNLGVAGAYAIPIIVMLIILSMGFIVVYLVVT